MAHRIVCWIMLALLFTGMFVFAINIQPTKSITEWETYVPIIIKPMSVPNATLVLQDNTLIPNATPVQNVTSVPNATPVLQEPAGEIAYSKIRSDLLSVTQAYLASDPNHKISISIEIGDYADRLALASHLKTEYCADITMVGQVGRRILADVPAKFILELSRFDFVTELIGDSLIPMVIEPCDNPSMGNVAEHNLLNDTMETFNVSRFWSTTGNRARRL